MRKCYTQEAATTSAYLCYVCVYYFSSSLFSSLSLLSSSLFSTFPLLTVRSYKESRREQKEQKLKAFTYTVCLSFSLSAPVLMIAHLIFGGPLSYISTYFPSPFLFLLLPNSFTEQLVMRAQIAAEKSRKRETVLVPNQNRHTSTQSTSNQTMMMMKRERERQRAPFFTQVTEQQQQKWHQQFSFLSVSQFGQYSLIGESVCVSVRTLPLCFARTFIASAATLL